MGEWTVGELAGGDAERARRFTDRQFGGPLPEGTARAVVVWLADETIPCPRCGGSGEVRVERLEAERVSPGEWRKVHEAAVEAFWRRWAAPPGDYQVAIEEGPGSIRWAAWADGHFDEPDKWKDRRPLAVDRILDERG